MKSHFIGRGYPEKNLDDSLDRVKLLSRKTLLTPKPPSNPTTESASEEVTVYAITTYHPTQQDFRKIIDSNWNLLGSPGTQKLFEARIIFGHRRPKNLREHLVRAALKPPPTDADRLLLSQRAKERDVHHMAGANIALDLIPVAPSRAIQMAGNLDRGCL